MSFLGFALEFPRRSHVAIHPPPPKRTTVEAATMPTKTHSFIRVFLVFSYRCSSSVRASILFFATKLLSRNRLTCFVKSRIPAFAVTAASFLRARTGALLTTSFLQDLNHYKPVQNKIPGVSVGGFGLKSLISITSPYPSSYPSLADGLSCFRKYLYLLA